MNSNIYSIAILYNDYTPNKSPHKLIFPVHIQAAHLRSVAKDSMSISSEMAKVSLIPFTAPSLRYFHTSSFNDFIALNPTNCVGSKY